MQLMKLSGDWFYLWFETASVHLVAGVGLRLSLPRIALLFRDAPPAICGRGRLNWTGLLPDFFLAARRQRRSGSKMATHRPLFRWTKRMHSPRLA